MIPQPQVGLRASSTENPTDVRISEVLRICALAIVNGICHYKWYDRQN